MLAHILVCFLAFVLWKLLGQLCQRAGLGNEPRRVLAELSELRAVDVVLPTREGPEIRTRCVTQRERASKDSAGTARFGTSDAPTRDRVVVEKPTLRALGRKHLRQTLGKLG